MRYLTSIFFTWSLSSLAYTGVTSDPAVWTLYYGTAIIKPRVAYKTPTECAVAALPLIERNQGNANYTCKATMAVKGVYSTKPITLPPNDPTKPVPLPYSLIPK
jgi:hypothetical protein